MFKVLLRFVIENEMPLFDFAAAPERASAGFFLLDLPASPPPPAAAATPAGYMLYAPLTCSDGSRIAPGWLYFRCRHFCQVKAPHAMLPLHFSFGPPARHFYGRCDISSPAHSYDGHDVSDGMLH